MTDEHLDRAIVEAQERVFNNRERVVGPLDRAYARALVAELIKDVRPTLDMNPRAWPGFNRAIYEIKRRAGICGECRITFNPIEPIVNGDFMPIREYLDDVKCGVLTDYDGYGHPATLRGKDTSIRIKPSEGKAKIPPEATHIVWYNR